MASQKRRRSSIRLAKPSRCFLESFRQEGIYQASVGGEEEPQQNVSYQDVKHSYFQSELLKNWMRGMTSTELIDSRIASHDVACYVFVFLPYCFDLVVANSASDEADGGNLWVSIARLRIAPHFECPLSVSYVRVTVSRR
jgi:hypothetical protein